MNNGCCICGKKAESEYSLIKHFTNNKSRVYTGHKSCLFSLESRLSLGFNVEYKELSKQSG